MGGSLQPRPDTKTRRTLELVIVKPNSKADEPREYSAALHISTSSSDEPTAPAWATEAIILARAWWSEWSLLGLVERVRLERGRAGTFDLIDFVLVLLAYQVSNARTIKDFYRQMRGGLDTALASVWSRSRLPSRSALSRALGAATATTVESLRELFF